ncbi:ribosome maturation factor RimM [Chitinophaga horti]|uniref:Ribosome maturation factor RimM n=1 Tax=Chitinophaga horti TaxID=2920382 RepID=A0ABY6J1F8_9BACT|nr:ribosome maturation factor RimM [Chitinophaga horti]UYQ93355.1 ribosome maturation factor RimM [Chitinophaga horti]
MTNYFSIGKISAIFGLEGEVVVKHSLGKRTSLKGVEVLFLEERKDSFIPYFMERAKPKDHEHVYVKLEGVSTPEQARKLLQRGIYLAETDFKQQAASSAPLSLLGFQVQDKHEGSLGVVEEVIEMPMQVLIKVTLDGKEMLLPINDQTLQKVDKKQQTVHLDLPEGLLDIYK